MFALAGHLGMTVSELGERMTWSELLQWARYFSVEPFGPVRDDLRQAIQTTAILTALGAKNIKPEAFMLNSKEGGERTERKARKQSAAQMADVMARFVAASGGKITRTRKAIE